MKRMYVVLSLFLVFFLTAGALIVYATDRDRDSDFMQKRMQMREEMHRRMIEKLLRGVGPDNDMFKDMEQFMDEVMTDSFSGLNSFTRTTAQSYKMEWRETGTGRTLEITPKDPQQQLDINVSDGLVVIKGKAESKTANGVSVSNFSNSFNVPNDCDPAKVKMETKEGKILLAFPYRNVKEIKVPEGRVPVKPSGDDVQI